MSRLPTGTVTFLFTDIEGSTRKWQNWPHKMKIALKRHDEILQKAIDDSGGWVFKTVGDAFCAAFHTAMDCIICVIEIQIAINSEEWDLPELIKVRMSIHTGEAIERNNDYYGPALNRVARLESLAYGGQVLMSLVTAELIRDLLPEPAGIKFMGDHRLKDLTRPEGVYQLTHPDIPAEFPPIKSLDSHPHNLSIQPGLLIGREKELGILQEKLLVSKSRIVSVTGTGGMGKTRISLQTAAELIEKFRNGVFFIDLTLISDASAFYSHILSVLSIKESGGKSEFELLVEYLNNKDILLILDNFEHVMGAAVSASILLSKCPGLKYLITSREALHIRGERVYRLPPLKVPVFDKNKILSIKKLTQYDSVRLFIERALEVNENFKIDNKNAPAVAEICIRLDGIPLAIELAAARITTLSPQALLKRLSHRLEILTFGAADLPDRQQTLRSTIDWSFDLLTKEMQDLFMSLSVFTGGFDIEAAEAVCRISKEVSVLDGIEHLLEKSLLIKTDMPGGEPWFYMLETIHEYASEQLQDCSLEISVKAQYSEYFLALAEEGESGIQSSDQKYWMDKLSHNHENFIAVLHSFEIKEEFEKPASMVGSLGLYWQYKGLFSEGISWYKKIQNWDIDDISLEDKLNIGLGRLLGEFGQYEESKKNLIDVLNSLSKENSNYFSANFELACTFYRLNDFKEAKEHFNKVILGSDEIMKARAELGIGSIFWRDGNLEKAEDYFLSSLSIFSNKGDSRSIAQAANNLGIIYYQKGILDEARTYFDKAVKKFKEIGEEDNLRNTLNNLGYLYYQKNKFTESIKKYKELVTLIVKTNDDFFLSTAYSGLASSYLELGKNDTAFMFADRARILVASDEDSIEYGISLRILGDISRINQKLEEAKKLYIRSISILEKAGEKEEVDIATSGLKKLN